MLEKHLRPKLDYFFFPICKFLSSLGCSPNLLTSASFLFGILTMPSLALGYPLLAVCFMWISGLLDVLDGSVARISNLQSNGGAILDIVSDRFVEFSIVMGLYFALPETETRALYCLLMLGSILICVTSFLVVGIVTENRSKKSFHYSPGIIERAEAFLFFSFMMLFPSAFSILAIMFISLVFLTAIIRIFEAVPTHP